MTDSQMWRAVVGARGGKPPADPASALQALRDAGVSTREIADQLGVSVRTVQRWSTTGASRRDPARSRSADKLVALGTNHPKVRSAALSRHRASRMRNQGGRVRMSGLQGPAMAGKDYRRNRQIEAELDGIAMEEVLARWQEGDDEGAAQALREALADEGYPEWDWDAAATVEFLGHRRE